MQQNAVLKDMYANYFRVGSVLNSGTVNNSSIKALILREFNSITCENEMKPDATLVQSGSTNTNIRVSLNRAASILNFCAQNNIAVRGHYTGLAQPDTSMVFQRQFPGQRKLGFPISYGPAFGKLHKKYVC